MKAKPFWMRSVRSFIVAFSAGVGLALATACTLGLRTETNALEGSPRFSGTDSRGLWYGRVERVPGVWELTLSRPDARRAHGTEVPLSELPLPIGAHAVVAEFQKTKAQRPYIRNRLGWGWPVACIHADREFVLLTGQQVEGMWFYRQRTGPEPWFAGGVPILPLWSGLALDTAAWGGLVWGGMAAYSMMRRRWLFRKQRCPSCGYPFGEHRFPRCSECGAEVARRS